MTDERHVELAKGIHAILEVLDPVDVKDSFWKARNIANHLVDRIREMKLIPDAQQISPLARGGQPSREVRSQPRAQSSDE